MITFIKHFLTSFFTAKELSRRRNFKKFIEIFNIRFFYAFNFVRRKFNKRIKFLSNTNSENMLNEINVQSNLIVRDLNSKGFNDDFKLNEKILNNILDEISLKNSSLSYKGLKKTKLFDNEVNPNDNIKTIVQKSMKNQLSHVTLDINMSKLNSLKQIASSKFFSEIANSYLGCEDISVSSLCYISNPVKISEKEKKDNAQYYHYDNDFKKFFKVFIYLNDVDINSGPHSFIQYSHKKKLYKHIVSKRINDDEIKKCYGRENIITFDRPKGSIIFEDTFGLHKGNYPKSQSRVVLILIYGIGQGIGLYNNSINISNAINH